LTGHADGDLSNELLTSSANVLDSGLEEAYL